MDLGGLIVGFLIGAESEVEDEASRYRREKVQLLLAPQAGRSESFDHLLATARQAARAAAAFQLSSGRGYPGWVADPRGEIVATTSDLNPFLTVQLPIDGARPG